MGMVPPVPMTMGARVPMMVNGVPPMMPATGFMGMYCTVQKHARNISCMYFSALTPEHVLTVT